MGMAFWHLEFMGCTDVHVLDGGMQAWLNAGGTTDTDNVNATITPSTFAGSEQTTLNCTTDQLKSYVDNYVEGGGVVLLDGRPDSEFMGYITKPFEPGSGRVKNSRQLYWWDYVDAATGKVKTAKECMALLNAQDVAKTDIVIHI